MKWGLGRCALRAAESPFSCPSLVVAIAGAMALAGCTRDGPPGVAAAQPRGATVAFESIDGPPPEQFRTLVQNLNDEAQSRRLAVISRESASAYRVRGYLAAKVAKGQTTISWVWDVFDRDEVRALRISGEETAKETAKGRNRDAWNSADEAMLRRIARAGMEQLAAFLTSREVAPNAPAASSASSAPRIALIGATDSSPEAAGIFRIFHANADPVATETAEAPKSAEGPLAVGGNTDSIPLPRRKPARDEAVSALETVTLVVSSR
ncbi:MAG: hypothetical protein HY543_01720 [Deltaproteobacteria bacterium]|nr:hypothetical protein [Deltaproteobacteria bacterium]